MSKIYIHKSNYLKHWLYSLNFSMISHKDSDYFHAFLLRNLPIKINGRVGLYWNKHPIHHRAIFFICIYQSQRCPSWSFTNDIYFASCNLKIFSCCLNALDQFQKYFFITQEKDNLISTYFVEIYRWNSTVTNSCLNEKSDELPLSKSIIIFID